MMDGVCYKHVKDREKKEEKIFQQIKNIQLSPRTREDKLSTPNFRNHGKHGDEVNRENIPCV